MMNSSRAVKIISWVLVAACMAVIFVLSAQKADASATLSAEFVAFWKIEFNMDFVRSCAHCAEFAGLALLLYNALYQTFGHGRPVIAFLSTAAYGVSDEIHQLFVEGRAFQLTDILIDSIGALTGVAAASAIAIIILKVKGRRSE